MATARGKKKVRQDSEQVAESRVKGRLVRNAPVDATPAALGKGPIWVDDSMYFSPFDLARYNLAEMRVIHANNELHLKQMEMEKAVQRFNKMMEQLKHAEAQRKAELVQLRSELEVLYPISFNDPKLTFDADTGRLMHDGAPILKP